MTISTLTRRMDYVGSGITGPYAYTFRILAATDLVVTTRNLVGTEATLVNVTDYAVTMASDGTGSITLTTALPTGYALTIRRVRPLLQTTDVRNQGVYFAEVHEDVFDNQTMVSQQQQDQIDRSLKLPTTVDPASVTTDLPVPVGSSVLGWNSLGTRIVNYVLEAASSIAVPLGRLVATVTQYLSNNAVFNVKDYGAVGDGLVNDTAAIQLALAAAAPTGGIVYFPIGSYVVTSTLVVTGGVTLRGGGSGYGTFNTCILLWMGTGFCIKMGNTAGALSYGMEVSNLRIALLTTNSGIWLYGAAHSVVRNVDIEGVQFTTASVGVQIDGADISSFFITLDSVQCNHVFKGFVHTTTGATVPTQVLGLNCSALCDHTANSIGIDIQNVAGNGCGDGVCYVSGNMEACATGVNLNAGGTSIIGMRFENTQGVASDVTFGALALDNKLIGCSGLYGLTDTAAKYSNQVIACSLDTSSNASQMNRLDALTLGEELTMTPNGTAARSMLVNATNTYTGSLYFQAGNRSAAYGGSLTLYGHAHASHPGDVVAGISSGSGGKFRVNSQGVDGGTDWFVVDGAGVGIVTILGLQAATVKAVGGFGCNGTTPQTAVAGGAALAAYGAGANGFDTAGHAQEIHDKLNTILTALRANGILTT